MFLKNIFFGCVLLYFININTCHGKEPPPILPNYHVTSILFEPFLMEKEDKNLQGNDRYEGFCKDLAEGIAKRINITYEFRIVGDHKFGHQYRKGGPFDGMIGEVQKGLDAQIGIAPITMTHARMKVVDFSTPFIEFQLGILMKDPDTISDNGDDDDDNDDDDIDDDDDDEHGQYIFLRPMSWILWIIFIIGILVTVGILFIVERLISIKIYEAKLKATIANDLPPLPPPIPIGLCTNGICGSPRSGTGRFIQIVFWIFIIIFLAGYIATFAADRVVDRLDEDDEDIKDLELKSIEDILDLEDQEVKLGCIQSGSTYEYFEKTMDRTNRRIFSLINNAQPKGFAKTAEEGIARVRNGNGTYAFIMEAPSAMYHTTRKPCNLIMAPEQFGPKRGFSVITHQGMPITREINLAILAMKENDELEEIEDRWLQDKSECKKHKDDDDDDDDVDDEDENDVDPLCLSDMAGIFYILLIALIISLIIAFLEIRHYTQPPRGVGVVRNDRALEVPMRAT